MLKFYKLRYILYRLTPRRAILTLLRFFFSNFPSLILNQFGRSLYSTYDPNCYSSSLSNVKPLFLSAIDKYKCTYRLDVNDHIGYSLFVKSEFDSCQTDSIIKFIRAHRDSKLVFIDFGAHIGSTFIPIAQFIPSIALELNAYSFARLSVNCSLNHIEPVCLINGALLSTSQSNLSSLGYTFNPSNSGNCIVTNPLGSAFPNQEFQALTIDAASLFSLFPVLRDSEIIIIKIDIEGMEFDILESFLPGLSKSYVIFFEYRPDLYPNQSIKLVDFFADNDIQVFAFDMGIGQSLQLSAFDASRPYKSLIATSDPSLLAF